MLRGITPLAALLAMSLLPQTPEPPGSCPRCRWSPPESTRIVRVRSADQLADAVREARPGTHVVLRSGTYALRSSVEVTASRIVIRGETGDPGSVVVKGPGMKDDRSVGVAFGIGASDVTIADLTIRDVGYHAVQVRGERGASRFTIHNARLVDAGQQLLKVSLGPAPPYADDGLVACSEFQYTSHAPSSYTNGVDVLGGAGWHIRDNRFLRIRGPQAGRWSAGPAVLVWAASERTIVERNTVLDSFRGIALGLSAGGATFTRNGERTYDHLDGVIRNNVIVNTAAWADEAIEANASRQVRIEHNSVFADGPWSIGIRYPSTSGLVRNNLTNRQILFRDGGRAELAGNVVDARLEWFVNAPGGDLRLTPAAAPAIDAGVHIPDVATDLDRRPRVNGRAPDAGAHESGG